MIDEVFFQEFRDQSAIKTEVVAKYFGAWASIMLSQPSRDPRIAYVDLFSGPGLYDDGTPSTPLILLEKAIRDPRLSRNLVTVFNDKNPLYVASLESLVTKDAKFDVLSHPPQIYNFEIGTDLFNGFSTIGDMPALYFVDPCGYKGLSLDLISNNINNWGCECIFFFNFNRIRAGINNPTVEDLMTDIFGRRGLKKLQAAYVSVQSPVERQALIIDELITVLREKGGKFVLPFEFISDKQRRTSHYIIFVNKHFRGYDIMKDIMYDLSTDKSEVRRFEYVPIRTSQLSMLPQLLDVSDPFSIKVLKELLLQECRGQVRTVKQIHEGHSVDTPYVLRNFKKALIELESEGRVVVDKPANKRVRSGIVTLGNDRIVSFV